VTPAAAFPGDVVSVGGFAPLVSVLGSNQPVVFQFAVLNGRPDGPEVKFGYYKTLGSALLGRALLDVLAPPSFAGLPDTAAIAEVNAGLTPISSQPATPSTVAWCSAGAVDVWNQGITTKEPTRAVKLVLRRLRLEPPSPLRCDAVALAGPASDPTAVIAAAFPAAPTPYGAPPFGEIALVTKDHGQTWAALPIPSGALALSFGGFRYRDGGVEAVFAKAMPNRKAPKFPYLDPARPLAELSSSDGRSWRAAPLGCPAGGPCVTVGPYLPGGCTMGAPNPAQPLLRSTDGGIHWSQPFLPDQVQACAEAELVATSRQEALLIDSMSQFPLQRTTDGGATWHVVDLPPAPGEQSYFLGSVAGVKSYVLGEGPGGITALPDGDLLLSGGQGYRGGWELLRHGADSWCTVRTPSARTQSLPQLSSLTVIGDTLWWLTGINDAAPVARHVELSAITC
jgi:hypothetical protein